MNHSSYYFLIFWVVLTPHLWPGVALVIALIFGTLAALHAWQEIKGHMRDIERGMPK